MLYGKTEELQELAFLVTEEFEFSAMGVEGGVQGFNYDLCFVRLLMIIILETLAKFQFLN